PVSFATGRTYTTYRDTTPGCAVEVIRARVEAGRAEAQLLIEAAKAKAFGKIIVAAVLESLARVLPCAPRMRASIEGWPGDLAGAGVIFRINAGLHALARSGRHAGLQKLYRAAEAGDLPGPVRLDAVLIDVLARHTPDLLQWMSGPTQTNEVARAAGFVAALLELNARAQHPCELLELGTSAGLNLNLAYYGCELGGTQSGDPLSKVQIVPRWQGRRPPAVPLVVERAAGVDLSPPDIRDDDDCERLHAYIWAGESERTERLRAAIAIARDHPPHVDTGLASRWLARQLALPQRHGTRRVVVHSMVVQYMPEVERAAVDAALALAAAAATPDRPLARIGMEWSADRSTVELCVTSWNGTSTAGRTVVVAHCHPYAEWFDWHGLSAG
ncbi:MAG TPA: DUF2332 family protein, partial [Novosphingobium sp.]|nr:DUF2332 family protein [Novosphingobium sp.]